MIKCSARFEQVTRTTMNITRYFLLTFAAVALFSVGAYGQARKKPVRRTTTLTKPATMPALDVRAARVKVSNQLANVTQFVDKFGPVAQALEARDAEQDTRRLSKQELDRNAADRDKVANSVRNLREGMVKLESEFRVKSVLKKYLPSIQGIGELAGQAETSAIAGKFVAANTSLRTVQQKLNDTLSAMPNAGL
ncbi:MAG: hypothetical protein ABIV48_05970 [Pyrinomonadaceae bacterium]